MGLVLIRYVAQVTQDKLILEVLCKTLCLELAIMYGTLKTCLEK
jgi:hypothetical protein